MTEDAPPVLHGRLDMHDKCVHINDIVDRTLGVKLDNKDALVVPEGHPLYTAYKRYMEYMAVEAIDDEPGPYARKIPVGE